MKKKFFVICSLCLLLSGCNVELNNSPVTIAEESIALASSPVSFTNSFLPKASGTQVKENSFVKIDYSNTFDGYVMVQYLEKTNVKIKVQVIGPNTTYTYNVTPKEWTTFPLSDGEGNYKITVFKNTTGSKYANVMSVTFKVKLNNEFEPFIRSNQYVNFEQATKTVSKAKELIGNESNTLEKVRKIYEYVTTNLTYDKQRAATVKSGYLPELDSVLVEKKGICFDYAALMAGMLRSQGVPCKLVIGYADKAYHAWISVWTDESGWIDGAIYFDGTAWQRMDPTFASYANNSESILRYISDGSHYAEKYLY